MDRKLRILLIEDSENDADLILLELAESGLEVMARRVETLDAVRAALAHEMWDLVISDFNLPRFSAASALAVLQELDIDIPFIVVSGFIGEEAAVALLKAGAHDFVTKDHLARLAPAIERELKEAANRREHRTAARELLESRRQLQELSAHLQSVREEERAHIARELHDGLGQMLTALKIDATRLHGRVAALDKAVAQKLDGMAVLIDETIEAVRRISSDLRPVMLDDLGLKAALEWLVEEFAKRHEDIRCELELGIDGQDVTDELATAAFRIVQECLNNAVKHAEASAIRISVGMRDGLIAIAVSDNGRGLPAQPSTGKGGYGLISMRERAQALGGTFSLASIPGGGVAVAAALPLAITGATP